MVAGHVGPSFVNPRSICKDCPAKIRAACERKEGHYDTAVVLDFPTAIEAKRGKLLDGDTGRLIKVVLEKAGLDHRKVYFTTALNCAPGKQKETVLRKFMANCRPRLVDELRNVGVKKVLCMGPVGFSAIMGEEKIARSVKRRSRWERSQGMDVLLTYAPILVLADNEWFRDFANDCAKFVQSTGKQRQPKITVFTPESRKEVTEAFEMIEAAEFTSCDFETTGFSPVDNFPLALGYCTLEDEHTGHAVVLDRARLADDWTWKHVARQLNSPQPTVFHNAPFDLKFMQFEFADIGTLKYAPDGIHDTMLLGYCLDERVGKYEPHNLEGMARRMYDAPDYGINMGTWLKKWEKEKDPAKRIAMEQEMYLYCGVDCYYTARLWPDLEYDLEDEEPKILDMYYDLMRPAMLALTDVMLRGIKLDVDQLHVLQEQLKGREDEIIARIRTTVGNPEFNPNSQPQMMRYMYEVLKLPPTKTARRGRLQEGPTSAAVIRILKEQFPEHKQFFEDVIAYRTAKKTVGTYVEGLINRMDSDGRIRTSLLLNGTATGRLSSRQPNLQNVPEVSHIEIDIRACFIPTSSDWLLLEADYSQLELRVAAHLSGDENWLQVYLEGRDLHQDVAGALYHKPREEVTPYQRWLAKNTVFGAMYGRGAESLALGPEMDYIENVFGGTRWSLEEAQQYFNNFFGKYKQFKQWIDDQHKTAYKQHYIETPFGRRRRFPFIGRNDAGLVKRQSVNSPIQSTASDITLSALININRRLLEFNEWHGRLMAHVVLTIHDSVMVECRKTVKDEVMEIMREEMQDNVALDSPVPFKADVHAADNWSGLK